MLITFIHLQNTFTQVQNLEECNNCTKCEIAYSFPCNATSDAVCMAEKENRENVEGNVQGQI